MSGPFRPGKANWEKCMEIMMFPPPNPLGRQLTIFNTQAQNSYWRKGQKGASSKASFLGSIMMVWKYWTWRLRTTNIKSMEVSGWWEKSHQSWEQRRRPPCHQRCPPLSWRPPLDGHYHDPQENRSWPSIQVGLSPTFPSSASLSLRPCSYGHVAWKLKSPQLYYVCRKDTTGRCS